jgi:AcrR family transcriptional regulator
MPSKRSIAPPDRPREGMRERKKRQRREAIARAALHLFDRYGFEQVSVHDVAVAADVSDMTVFNYFAVKEQLVFTEERERENAFIGAVRDRPPGTSVLDAFRAATLDLLGHTWSDRSKERIRVIHASPALQQYRRELYARQARALATELHDEFADLGEVDDLLLVSVAHVLFATVASALDVGAQLIVHGKSVARARAEMQARVDRVYETFSNGLRDFAIRELRRSTTRVQAIDHAEWPGG